MSKMFSDMVHFIQKYIYIYMIFFTYRPKIEPHQYLSSNLKKWQKGDTLANKLLIDFLIYSLSSVKLLLPKKLTMLKKVTLEVSTTIAFFHF